VAQLCCKCSTCVMKELMCMRHDMMSCGQVKKIKRHGLATMDRLASVKEKLEERK